MMFMKAVILKKTCFRNLSVDGAAGGVCSGSMSFNNQNPTTSPAGFELILGPQGVA